MNLLPDLVGGELDSEDRGREPCALHRIITLLLFEFVSTNTTKTAAYIIVDTISKRAANSPGTTR